MTMIWPFDTSEPRITPEALLDHYCEREGVTREQILLPPTLVATFQGAAYARLVEQTGAKVPPEFERRSSGGTALGAQFLIGRTPRDGKPIAVTRLPVGGPATALALESAIARGARDILVCGSAGSLQPELTLGSTVVVTAAEREDGTSHHYLPAGALVAADSRLATSLEQASRDLGAAPVRGRTWTTDAPFRETVGAIERHRGAGVAVVDMEAAAIFAVARVRSVGAGLVVAISDEMFHPWKPGFHLPEYLDALLRSADSVLLAADLLDCT